MATRTRSERENQPTISRNVGTDIEERGVQRSQEPRNGERVEVRVTSTRGDSFAGVIDATAVDTFLPENNFYGIASSKFLCPKGFKSKQSFFNHLVLLHEKAYPLMPITEFDHIPTTLDQAIITLVKKLQKVNRRIKPNIYLIVPERAPIDKTTKCLVVDKRFSGEICHIPFQEMIQLREINKKIHDVYVHAIGNLVKELKIPTWKETYEWAADSMYDYKAEQLTEFQAATKNSTEEEIKAQETEYDISVQGLTDEIEIAKHPESAWQGIESEYYLSILKRPWSRREIERKISKIKWDTIAKKKILVVIRAIARTIESSKKEKILFRDIDNMFEGFSTAIMFRFDYEESIYNQWVDESINDFFSFMCAPDGCYTKGALQLEHFDNSLAKKIPNTPGELITVMRFIERHTEFTPNFFETKKNYLNERKRTKSSRVRVRAHDRRTPKNKRRKSR